MDDKKIFREPLCDIVQFAIEDIVTSSWPGGLMPFVIEDVEKPE